jgi:hypothetical protein
MGSASSSQHKQAQRKHSDSKKAKDVTSHSKKNGKKAGVNLAQTSSHVPEQQQAPFFA